MIRHQLALNLRLKDAASFDNFFAGANAEALATLRALLAGSLPPRVLYLWGESGCGKTHLLHAACRDRAASSRAPVYVLLAEVSAFEPSVIEDVEQSELVCLDDLDKIAGNREWEAALFRLYERLRESGGALIATATANPSHLPFVLPDLATRLASGLVYQLHPLDDNGKIAAIGMRARHRGFDLDEDVARYILARYPRDTHSLFALLDRLDRQSFADQRRVTVPFVRELELTADVNRA